MKKTIVVIASGWGAAHGGINAFNMDFCHAMRRNIAEYLTCVVVVPNATAEELNDAKSKNIELIKHGVQPESFLENSPQTAEHIVESLQNQGLGDVIWWFGHDAITGPLATACRDVADTGSIAIFQHMDYEAYQSIKKQNGNVAIEMRNLQKDTLKAADIVFGIGPLLTETAKRYLEKPEAQNVYQVIPGLQNIGETFLSDQQFQAIIMGRMTQEDDRVKQGRLAAASFAEFAKLVRDQTDRDVWFTVFGFPEAEQDYQEEYKELNQLMTTRAKRALNVKPISYTKDREALFGELARSHVCMMLSLHEGFGLVGWEAIAAKTPLILSTQSGLYKLLKKENLDGYVWPVPIDAPDVDEPKHEDIERVKKQLQNILKNHTSNSVKERMQKLFSELIQLGYTWDKTAKDCCTACGIGLLEPFVGLNRISANRSEYFGGREEEINDLLEKIKTARFVVIYGPSGVGKSSLMDAGLLGTIRKKAGHNTTFCHVFVRLSTDPFNSLAKALLKYDENLTGYEKDSFGKQLKSSPQLLTKIIKDILSRKSQNTELIIAVDQLEELFTIVAQEEDRRKFINMLVESSQNSNTRIVTTIRADYYGMLSQYEKLTPLLNFGNYAVGFISGQKMVEAITKPLTQAGWECDKGLPEKISEDAGAELGSLPLIAMCLYNLQKKSILREETCIRKEDYQGLGSVVNNCAQTVEKKLGEAFIKEQLYRLFFHLVRVNDDDNPVRRKIPNTEIIKDESLLKLVDVLVNERLLVTGLIEEIEVVEIAHDSLFRTWEHLKSWIDDNFKSLHDFQKIEMNIQNWAENEDEDYLGEISFGLAENKSMQILQMYVESRENDTNENITLGFKEFFSGKEDLINLWYITNRRFQKRISLARAVEDGELSDISKMLNDGVTLKRIDVHTKRVDPIFYAAVTGDDDYDFLSTYIDAHPSSGLRRARRLKNSIFSANNVYRTTRSGKMPLHLAAVSGQIKVLRKILALGVNVDTPAASSGTTALSYALARGRSDDVVQLLLNYGADVSKKDYQGWTIFLAAAFGGKLDFLQRRSWKKEEKQALVQEWTALHLSVQSASIEMINYLLEQGLDPCQKNDDDSNAMMIAAVRGRKEIVLKLLKLVNVNQKDVYGMTALMWAALNGYIEIVKILLKPTEVNTWNNFGDTALMNIVQSKEIDTTEKLSLCEILVAEGAFIGLQNFEGKTVFDMTEDEELLAWLKLKSKSEKIEQTVIDKIREAGENKLSAEQKENEEDLVSVFNLRDKQSVLTFSGSSHAYLEVSIGGRNILHYAIMQGDIKQVKQLLKNAHRFELNGQDDIGCTPLMLAASKGLESIVELLLVEHGALLECEDMFGRTVIHHAAASGNTNLFDFFRDQGAKIDQLSDAGYHALHAAVYNSQRKMIVHLMEQLDPSKVTIDGETCLSLCEDKDCFYVLRDLLCQLEKPLCNAQLEFIAPDVPTFSLLERALICFASPSQPDWSSLPAMGLDWHEVSDLELARKWISCFDQTDMEDNDETGIQRTFWRYGLFGMRIAKLPFYSNCLLVDMKLNAFFNREHATLSFIVKNAVQRVDSTPNFSKNDIILLDGSSEIIHELNNEMKLDLSNDKNLSALYLRFFSSIIRAEQGVFWILDNVDDIPWKHNVSDAEIELLSKNVTALKISDSQASKSQYFSATVLYGGILFMAEFAVSDNGKVNMIHDSPIDNGIDYPLSLSKESHRGIYHLIEIIEIEKK